MRTNEKIEVMLKVKEETEKIALCDENNVIYRLIHVDHQTFDTRKNYLIYPPCLGSVFCRICLLFGGEIRGQIAALPVLASSGYSPKKFSNANKHLRQHEASIAHSKAFNKYTRGMQSFLDVSGLGSSFGQISIETESNSAQSIARNRHIVESVVCAVMYCISAGMLCYAIILF